MALFTESDIRASARKALRNDQTLSKAYSTRDSREVLRESVLAFSKAREYNMFISHSIRDAELILGVKQTLKDLGYSPYIDWIEDPTLDRNNVTSKTAETLRQRMRQSQSLFYVTTQNSDSSKWMPWECGYFDGFRGKVAIMPIKGQATSVYQGLEYLGLYPYTQSNKDTTGRDRLWIHKSPDTYLVFDDWVKDRAGEILWRKLGAA